MGAVLPAHSTLSHSVIISCDYTVNDTTTKAASQQPLALHDAEDSQGEGLVVTTSRLLFDEDSYAKPYRSPFAGDSFTRTYHVKSVAFWRDDILQVLQRMVTKHATQIRIRCHRKDQLIVQRLTRIVLGENCRITQQSVLGHFAHFVIALFVEAGLEIISVLTGIHIHPMEVTAIGAGVAATVVRTAQAVMDTRYDVRQDESHVPIAAARLELLAARIRNEDEEHLTKERDRKDAECCGAGCSGFGYGFCSKRAPQNSKEDPEQEEGENAKELKRKQSQELRLLPDSQSHRHCPSRALQDEKDKLDEKVFEVVPPQPAVSLRAATAATVSRSVRAAVKTSLIIEDVSTGDIEADTASMLRIRKMAICC